MSNPHLKTKTNLLAKYDVPVPRYTSYPTVPYWDHSPTREEWIGFLKKSFEQPQMTWALYVHIPFCETLCTFCGCNTTITRNHDREEPYKEVILKEWEIYLNAVPEIQSKPLRQLHLGGGTPTFFSAKHLKDLIERIFAKVQIDFDQFDGSIEVDPRRTTKDQLEALYALGFRRVSLGVQDFNLEVQRLVNRIQPFSQTKKITDEARTLGYTSVNFDLIYGLPKQTPESIKKTAEQTLELRPDRIALYSFAKVPWIKPAQRLFKDEDLPEGAQKRELYEIASDILKSGGYVEVGMDHFALKSDALYESMVQKKLHRNFMGYTEMRTDVLLGIGVSSISETPYCFHQNEKVLPKYEKLVEEKVIPGFRGHILTEEDRRQRELILQLMTQMEAPLTEAAVKEDVSRFLKELIEDEIVRIEGDKLKINPEGKAFLRNAAMAFDQRLRQKQPTARIFSQSL